MAVNPPGGGWALDPFGQPSQSTMAPMTPQQVAQIQATTAAMQQGQPATPQQNAMLGGLFGPQSNFGPNLGSMGTALWGSSPAYGGGNILSGDAYGGSAAAPIPGLTAADYG
jgi:hypothetical protein